MEITCIKIVFFGAKWVTRGVEGSILERFADQIIYFFFLQKDAFFCTKEHNYIFLFFFFCKKNELYF